MTRLPGLDALRGIAALIVVAGHALIAVGHPDSAGKFVIAVDVFFVLSGFVMARTYEHRMPSAPKFMAIRIKRLWPTMAVGGVLGALSVAANPPPDFLLLTIAGILLVPTTVSALVFPLNSPTWSIVSELFANLLHALGLFQIRPWLLAACGTWLLFMTYLPYGAWGAGPFQGDFLGSLPRAAGSYCIGIALFRLEDRLPKLPFWPVFTLPILLILPDMGGAADLVIAMTIPTISTLCALAGNGSRVLQILGAASFPLYAIHEPVQRLVQQFDKGVTTLVIVPLALTIAYVIISKRRVREPRPELMPV